MTHIILRWILICLAKIFAIQIPIGTPPTTKKTLHLFDWLADIGRETVNLQPQYSILAWRLWNSLTIDGIVCDVIINCLQKTMTSSCLLSTVSIGDEQGPKFSKSCATPRAKHGSQFAVVSIHLLLHLFWVYVVYTWYTWYTNACARLLIDYCRRCRQTSWAVWHVDDVQRYGGSGTGYQLYMYEHYQQQHGVFNISVGVL